MVITEIKVRKLPGEGPLRGFATVVFDGSLAVHGIKIIEAGGKRFSVFPSVAGRNGESRNVAHPVTSEFRAYLEKEIFEALDNAEVETRPSAEE